MHSHKNTHLKGTNTNKKVYVCYIKILCMRRGIRKMNGKVKNINKTQLRPLWTMNTIVHA